MRQLKRARNLIIISITIRRASVNISFKARCLLSKLAAQYVSYFKMAYDRARCFCSKKNFPISRSSRKQNKKNKTRLFVHQISHNSIRSSLILMQISMQFALIFRSRQREVVFVRNRLKPARWLRCWSVFGRERKRKNVKKSSPFHQYFWRQKCPLN